MARPKKQHSPSPPRTIEPPSSLIPLMLAFHVSSDKAAKALIAETAMAIYGKTHQFGFDDKRTLSKDELDGISALMRAIKPMDALETLQAAQIIATHMLGMQKLSEGNPDDQRIGLNLLRFSSEAMQRLERKRGGGVQNITVNYNYNSQGNALIQTVIPDKSTQKCQSEE